MSTLANDETYMRQCLELAALGRGHVAPNPLVGCVIVKDDVVIGKGHHRAHGEAHAEIEAMNNVEDPSTLKTSTLYVNLEPCVHHGKTPPCAPAIIKAGISRVVIAALDPNPLVSGKGKEMLESAGVEVLSGLLASEEKELNKRFRTFHEKKRPYLILKWAQSADGFMDVDRATGFTGQFQISNEASRDLVHFWRSREGGVMIGTNTAENDNPKLTVRRLEGRSPLRIVLDPNGRLPNNLHLFTDGEKTLVFSRVEKHMPEQVDWRILPEGEDFLSGMMKVLYQEGVQSVMVEGGSKLLHAMINASLWDEARIFVSREKLKAGLKAPSLDREAFSQEDVDDNKLLYYRNGQ